MGTPFTVIIDKFLGKITDDMYLELTYEDTIKDSKQFLLDAIPYFEFPRFALYNFDEKNDCYNIELTDEEINILAVLMKEAWLERQISSIENIRMKYSSADFKMTSQANHLSKLLQLKNENQRESMHMQRLYKRRRPTSNGGYVSNWDTLKTGVYYGNRTRYVAVSAEGEKKDTDWGGIEEEKKTPTDDNYYWEGI